MVTLVDMPTLGKHKWAVLGDEVTEHTSEHHDFAKWEGEITATDIDEYLNIVSYNRNKIPPYSYNLLLLFYW